MYLCLPKSTLSITTGPFREMKCKAGPPQPKANTNLPSRLGEETRAWVSARQATSALCYTITSNPKVNPGGNSTRTACAALASARPSKFLSGKIQVYFQPWLSTPNHGLLNWRVGFGGRLLVHFLPKDCAQAGHKLNTCY